ncbi:hypothetical protein GOV08_05130 [Candidatus Woesearchaeota archaeon]|nr:hypothetical protein [Candidatus Woesearchaeota archaeon]
MFEIELVEKKDIGELASFLQAQKRRVKRKEPKILKLAVNSNERIIGKSPSSNYQSPKEARAVSMADYQKRVGKVKIVRINNSYNR